MSNVWTVAKIRAVAKGAIAVRPEGGIAHPVPASAALWLLDKLAAERKNTRKLRAKLHAAKHSLARSRYYTDMDDYY